MAPGRVERHADERGRLGQRLEDLAAAGVEHLDAVVAIAGQQENEPVAAGSRHHRERIRPHVANRTDRSQGRTGREAMWPVDVAGRRSAGVRRASRQAARGGEEELR